MSLPPYPTFQMGQAAQETICHICGLFVVDPDAFTPREGDILVLVVAGMGNERIAQQLGIGSKTVKTHMTNLFKKTRCHSRTHLAITALTRGWVVPQTKETP